MVFHTKGLCNFTGKSEKGYPQCKCGRVNMSKGAKRSKSGSKSKAKKKGSPKRKAQPKSSSGYSIGYGNYRKIRDNQRR